VASGVFAEECEVVFALTRVRLTDAGVGGHGLANINWGACVWLLTLRCMQCTCSTQQQSLTRTNRAVIGVAMALGVNVCVLPLWHSLGCRGVNDTTKRDATNNNKN